MQNPSGYVGYLTLRARAPTIPKGFADITSETCYKIILLFRLRQIVTQLHISCVTCVYKFRSIMKQVQYSVKGRQSTKNLYIDR